MTNVEVVLDAGPIPYREIALYGDPDLEHGLRHAGFEPHATSYRLVEIPLAAIDDVRSLSRRENMSRVYIDKVMAGVDFPPVVVLPTPSGWALLDGVNRTYAYWVLGRTTVRAYDLIVEMSPLGRGPHSTRPDS
jgi:hypothetical protein